MSQISTKFANKLSLNFEIFEIFFDGLKIGTQKNQPELSCTKPTTTNPALKKLQKHQKIKTYKISCLKTQSNVLHTMLKLSEFDCLHVATK